MIKIKQIFFFIILGIGNVFCLFYNPFILSIHPKIIVFYMLLGVYCRSPSKASNNEFILNLTNDLDYRVELYWIDYNGDMDNNPVTLPSNTSFPLNSFYNHRWAISTQKEEYKEILLGFDEVNKSNQKVKISSLLYGDKESDIISNTTTSTTTDTTTAPTTSILITTYTTTSTATDTTTSTTTTVTETTTLADTTTVENIDFNRTKNSIETTDPVKLGNSQL